MICKTLLRMVFVITLVIFVTPICWAQEEEVLAEGMGATSQEATRNAQRNAVEQTVGTLITSESVVENDALIHDEILTYSGGYIQSWETVSQERQKDGGYRVKIRAVVLAHRLSDKLVQLKISGVTSGQDIETEFRTKQERGKQSRFMVAKALEPFLNATCVKADIIAQKVIVDSKLKGRVHFRGIVEIDQDCYAKARQELVAVLRQVGVQRPAVRWTSDCSEYFQNDLGVGSRNSPTLAIRNGASVETQVGIPEECQLIGKKGPKCGCYALPEYWPRMCRSNENCKSYMIAVQVSQDFDHASEARFELFELDSSSIDMEFVEAMMESSAGANTLVDIRFDWFDSEEKIILSRQASLGKMTRCTEYPESEYEVCELSRMEGRIDFLSNGTLVLFGWPMLGVGSKGRENWSNWPTLEKNQKFELVVDNPDVLEAATRYEVAVTTKSGRRSVESLKELEMSSCSTRGCSSTGEGVGLLTFLLFGFSVRRRVQA